MGEKIKKAVERKYVEDSRKLSLYWPAETITIYDLSLGRKSIKLHSGDLHEFDEGEVGKLLEITPKYYWKLMRIPLMLRYYKEEDGTVKLSVEGGVWQARLAELLLTGEVSSEGLKNLSLNQFSKLVSRYKTLVFVTLAT
jgi:uncharacterized protein (UPF0216 family)